MLSAAAPVQVSVGEQLQLHCLLPLTFPPTFNLTWTFRHSNIILSSFVLSTRWRAVEVSERWRPHIAEEELEEEQKDVGRSLMLRWLDVKHSGSFSCEVITAEGRYVTWTNVTVSRGEEGEEKKLEGEQMKFLCDDSKRRVEVKPTD